MSNKSSASTPSDRLGQIRAHIALDKPSMAGKVCIITGASSLYGIGYGQCFSRLLHEYFVTKNPFVWAAVLLLSPLPNNRPQPYM